LGQPPIAAGGIAVPRLTFVPDARVWELIR